MSPNSVASLFRRLCCTVENISATFRTELCFCAGHADLCAAISALVGGLVSSKGREHPVVGENFTTDGTKAGSYLYIALSGKQSLEHWLAPFGSVSAHPTYDDSARSKDLWLRILPRGLHNPLIIPATNQSCVTMNRGKAEFLIYQFNKYVSWVVKIYDPTISTFALFFACFATALSVFNFLGGFSWFSDSPVLLKQVLGAIIILPVLVMIIWGSWVFARALNSYVRNEKKLAILMNHWHAYESLPNDLTFGKLIDPHFKPEELARSLALHQTIQRKGSRGAPSLMEEKTKKAIDGLIRQFKENPFDEKVNAWLATSSVVGCFAELLRRNPPPEITLVQIVNG